MVLRLSLLNLRRHLKRTLLTGSLIMFTALVLVSTDAYGAAVNNNLVETVVRNVTGHLQVRPAGASSDPLRPELSSVAPLPRHRYQALQDTLADLPGVSAVAPRLRHGGLLVSGDRHFGAMLVGISPRDELTATPLLRIDTGRVIDEGDDEGLLLSAFAAAELGLAVGEAVAVMAARPDGTPVSSLLRVRGIIDTGASGMFIDHIAYLSLERFQELLGLEGATELKVLLDDESCLKAVLESAAGAAPGLEVMSYRDLGGEILGIAAVSDLMFEIIFLVLSLVAAAGVLNTMLMAVAERRRELGVLAALGARPRRIVSLILAEAGLMALFFALAGALVAAGGAAYFAGKGIHFGEAMMIIGAERLYPVLDWPLVLTVPLRLVAIALAGAVFPALAAARTDPAEAMKP